MGLNEPLVRLHNSVHSGLLNELDERISVLIFDESHKAKGANKIFYAAMKSLDYDHAFLLSGTPMPNTWQDLASQLMLLPGESPITNAKHYSLLFGTYDSEREIVLPPSGARLKAWQLFLTGVMFGRPQSALDLAEPPVHTVNVDMKEELDKAILMDVYVNKACNCSQKRDTIQNMELRSKYVKPALALIARARCLEQHPALINPLGDDGREEAIIAGECLNT